MKTEIKIKASSTKGKITVSGGGRHRVIKAVVFSTEQLTVIQKAADHARVSVEVRK